MNIKIADNGSRITRAMFNKYYFNFVIYTDIFILTLDIFNKVDFYTI